MAFWFKVNLDIAFIPKRPFMMLGGGTDRVYRRCFISTLSSKWETGTLRPALRQHPPPVRREADVHLQEPAR